jgi:hypothetical protein
LLLKTLGLPDFGQPVLTRRRPPSAVLRHQRASCSTATTASFPATSRSTGASCTFPASERRWQPSSPFGFSLSAGSRLADGWARRTRLTPLLSDRLPSARSTYAQGSNDLKVQANGDGGLEEVADEFRDGRWVDGRQSLVPLARPVGGGCVRKAIDRPISARLHSPVIDDVCHNL